MGGGSFAQYIQDYFPAVSPSLVCRKRTTGRQAHQEHEVAAAAEVGVGRALFVNDDDNESAEVHHAKSPEGKQPWCKRVRRTVPTVDMELNCHLKWGKEEGGCQLIAVVVYSCTSRRHTVLYVNKTLSS